jgi:DNA-binding CsgD family transcriptional regulator
MDVLVIQGGPGTGKTHTLAEIRKRAVKSGALCLRASGFHDERLTPFAALSQLTHTPGIPEGLQSALLRLIDAAACAAPADISARFLREVVAEVAACAPRQPLFLLFDDVHYMDTASRSCLLHITRCIESHDITVALAFPRTCDGRVLDPLEFVGLGARLIETTTMREAVVNRLLKRRTDADTARRLTSRVHAISGGNPALVTALVRDLAHSGPWRPGDALPVGDGFRVAYLCELVRHPHLAACVEALAVLSDHATPGRVARLLGQCPVVTKTYLEELGAVGMLAGSEFRHPAVPGFVLGAMDGTRLRQLNRRAAELLFSDCAPTAVVARYLLIADDVPDVSQVRVLLHASRRRTDPAAPPGNTVPPQSGVQDASNLSEAEWRVAALAAEGMSNRQIAKQLFVTVSTVEQHLTRVYRKLRIRRSDLSHLLLPSLRQHSSHGQ